MKKISKRVREEAALICSALACESGNQPFFDVAGEWLGCSAEAAALADAAWQYASSHAGSDADTEDAEAESLLRSGEFPVES